MPVDQLCKLLNVLLIQFFFIYKLPSLFYTFFFIYLQNCLIFIFIFWKHRYEMLTNGKVQNKCKVGILGAKFGNHVGSVVAKVFVFEGANSLKKLSGFYFYLLLEFFGKKKN